MKRSAFGLVLVLSAVSPSLVWAQAQTQDMKDADTLYNDGVAAMKDGRFADACPKLERSNKLEPGVGVMLWLANCYEKIGKTASAFNQYIAAEQLAAQTKDDRAKVAHKYAAGLEAKLSKLVIALPTGGHVDGLEVRRDGDLVKSFGDSVTVDPGTHLIEASAPGYKHWESKVDVGTDGATASVNVGPLEKEETKVQEKIVERRVEVSSWTHSKSQGWSSRASVSWGSVWAARSACSRRGAWMTPTMSTATLPITATRKVSRSAATRRAPRCCRPSRSSAAAFSSRAGS